ncbi:MAG: hypothetical protein QXT19_00040 [Candidatus Woesearchaeota archaeon]
MILSFREIFDMALMTLAVGYIFMMFFTPRGFSGPFNWRALWFACLVTAPALILHELSHKFVAMGFGMDATFHAAYFFLGIGVLLRLAHSPFIFFVPAYVTINCAGLACTIPPADSAIIAFAGPAVNLLLFVTAWLVLKYRRIRDKRWFVFWFITQRINLLLFVLNMLPLPGFDGWKVYSGLWQAFA